MTNKNLVRKIRHIQSAPGTGYNYVGKLYAEYGNGDIDFIRDITVSAAQTNVRLRKSGSAWEDYKSSCPGWFRCEALEI